VQGYYYSKPVVAEEITALLRKGGIVPVRPKAIVEGAIG
jgi:hypothetical protein